MGLDEDPHCFHGLFGHLKPIQRWYDVEMPIMSERSHN
jgi:hypothetical protein